MRNTGDRRSKALPDQAWWDRVWPRPLQARVHDALDAIGYEAADPMLQTPLWQEALQRLPELGGHP